jgi:AP-3 complex subunit mu
LAVLYQKQASRCALPVFPLLPKLNSVFPQDNFDIVLALLEEMMASGRPLLSEAAQLRELVVPPSQLLAKVALGAANVAGCILCPSPPSAPRIDPLKRSQQSLRRYSIYLQRPSCFSPAMAETRHQVQLERDLSVLRLAFSSARLTFCHPLADFDLTEHLSYILDSKSKITTASIAGDVACRSRLSGMPDLTLSFTDASQLEDCAFHSSVRYARWGKERVVSFVPREFGFPLFEPRVRR